MWIYDLSGASSMRRLTVQGKIAIRSGPPTEKESRFSPIAKATLPFSGSAPMAAGPPNASPGQSLGLRTSRNRGRRRATGSCSVCSERVERHSCLCGRFPSGQEGGTVWRRPVVHRQSGQVGLFARWAVGRLHVGRNGHDGRASSQSRRQAPSIRSRKVGPPLPCGCRMERESFTLIRKPHLQEAQEDSSS